MPWEHLSWSFKYGSGLWGFGAKSWTSPGRVILTVLLTKPGHLWLELYDHHYSAGRTWEVSKRIFFLAISSPFSWPLPVKNVSVWFTSQFMVLEEHVRESYDMVRQTGKPSLQIWLLGGQKDEMMQLCTRSRKKC